MPSPEEALQDAIVTRLRDDVALAALVGNDVFDEVPGDEAGLRRYVYLGAMNTRLPTDGSVPLECAHDFWAVTLRIFSAGTDDFGRLGVWETANAVRASLHRAEPALAEPYCLVGPLMVSQAGDVLEPQGPKEVFVDVTALVQT
jgi:hypothetical protein